MPACYRRHASKACGTIVTVVPDADEVINPCGANHARAGMHGTFANRIPCDVVDRAVCVNV